MMERFGESRSSTSLSSTVTHCNIFPSRLATLQATGAPPSLLLSNSARDPPPKALSWLVASQPGWCYTIECLTLLEKVWSVRGKANDEENTLHFLLRFTCAKINLLQYMTKGHIMYDFKKSWYNRMILTQRNACLQSHLRHTNPSSPGCRMVSLSWRVIRPYWAVKTITWMEWQTPGEVAQTEWGSLMKFGICF